MSQYQNLRFHVSPSPTAAYMDDVTNEAIAFCKEHGTTILLEVPNRKPVTIYGWSTTHEVNAEFGTWQEEDKYL